MAKRVGKAKRRNEEKKKIYIYIRKLIRIPVQERSRFGRSRRRVEEAPITNRDGSIGLSGRARRPARRGRGRNSSNHRAFRIPINWDLESFSVGAMNALKFCQNVALCMCIFFPQRNPRPFSKLQNLGFRQSGENRGKGSLNSFQKCPFPGPFRSLRQLSGLGARGARVAGRM